MIKTILITGATGFLGKRLTERLLQENVAQNIIATGRNEIIGKNLAKVGAKFFPGSLEDPDFVNEITKNATVIVHCAALASPWGKYEYFYNSNILSTQNLLNASKQSGVKRFVHISTPSIYFNGKNRFNIFEDESLPKKFSNYYAETKYEAEKLVNQSFSAGLETIILRPRAIIGAGDYTIFPRLLKAQNSGRLKIIGDGNTIADLTSVSNVIDAILLSIHAKSEALGQAYNITNGNPVKLWEFIDFVFQELNLKLNKKKIPYRLAFTAASILEIITRLSGSEKEPALTKQGIGVLAKSSTLNIDKARNLLGYQPKQSNEEAVQEFIFWYKNLNNNLL